MGGLEWSNSQRQAVGQWFPGLGPWVGWGGCCVMGTESQFGIMKKFCGEWWAWLHNSVTVLSATETVNPAMYILARYIFFFFRKVHTEKTTQKPE